VIRSAAAGDDHEARETVATLTPIRRQAADVVARIRALRRTGCVTISEAEIVALTRSGRR
jgi:hypothetical protein